MSTGPDGHPIDINECDLIDTACTNGTCVNTDSSFKCDCGKGYHLDADGTTCVGKIFLINSQNCSHFLDTNECAALVNPCGRGECANDEGGFTCECEDGYAPTGPNGSCQGRYNQFKRVENSLESQISTNVQLELINARTDAKTSFRIMESILVCVHLATS